MCSFNTFNFHIMQCVFTLVWLIGLSLHIMRLIIKQSIFIPVYEQLYQGIAGKRKRILRLHTWLISPSHLIHSVNHIMMWVGFSLSASVNRASDYITSWHIDRKITTVHIDITYKNINIINNTRCRFNWV